MSIMPLELKIRKQLEVVTQRISDSLEHRLAVGEDGIPVKMDCSDGEDVGWKLALEWVLYEMKRES
jgi:hypothetical protein